ncbi:CLUMA_CG017300, isoform A [Clunio marinus]|uniref:CLUMA_CG017300, isoform A n=1 Tax=Clunio marinus TaxID=568069 RepID=A0A1J1IXB2_9DIPT|nr:CLUMA_CG017300, isoform A [Clunio marinus]
MKAVGNHLVLTFCEKSELFTIILTRTKNLMPIEDVESIHALLGRRGLAVQSVRELCRNNSAIRLTLHTAVVFTLMMIFLMGN